MVLSNLQIYNTHIHKWSRAPSPKNWIESNFFPVLKFKFYGRMHNVQNHKFVGKEHAFICKRCSFSTHTHTKKNEHKTNQNKPFNPFADGQFRRIIKESKEKSLNGGFGWRRKAHAKANEFAHKFTITFAIPFSSLCVCVICPFFLSSFCFYRLIHVAKPEIFER